MTRSQVTIDGNEAVARVAYACNEVIAIYPITPSSPMGEWADAWAAEGRTNLWGLVPSVSEMQSEGGAAGAVHGALQTGALTTTFTASQGLLLMIPNMFKIAGELTPAVFHVAARTIATHALSIFGDHSDVMAARSTGWAMLASNSVQEAMDFALIAQAATLEARVPFLHFFDGFRTSHEVSKIDEVGPAVMRAMIDERLVHAHRMRRLSPDRPVLRGSAQNPDVFFQAREAVNPFYTAVPGIVQKAMDRFAELTGRSYRNFEYVGRSDAENVLVLMGSGAEAAEETIEHFAARGERVGLVKVRLFRPFCARSFVEALPRTVRVIAALDRTKEPGSVGEPLYQDVVTAVSESLGSLRPRFAAMPRILGGRYGLSSKEFTPAMVRGILLEMTRYRPRNHFTIGINDDMSMSSIDYDRELSLEPADVFRAQFYGLGADGTVGANKNSIKIIGEETDHYVQGYFVYDSKKAGTVTVSHLRFGPRPIRSTYLVDRASFVACHQFNFLERIDVLRDAAPGAIFLLNSSHSADEVWGELPRRVQQQILARKLRLFVVDAYRIARETGMGRRINTIMQTCFFALADVLPPERALEAIKRTIRKTYEAKGAEVVARNIEAVDRARASLQEVDLRDRTADGRAAAHAIPHTAPPFVQGVTAPILAGRGDDLPVSAFAPDGTFPVGTARYEKRSIALEIPAWDPALCIQCGKCVVVCPHAAIRAKAYDPKLNDAAPAGFRWMDARGSDFGSGLSYALQVAPDDCTGCAICVDVCPAKSKENPKHRALDMVAQLPIRDAERSNFEFFLGLPEYDRRLVRTTGIKGVQLLKPLFEYSGACAGCGETPYVRLLSQLFGDRMIVANATGCSSIYGGNLPTTPWTTDAHGRGPAWSNSLFEDNAEFGLGFRLTVEKHTERARALAQGLAPLVGEALVSEILSADQSDEPGIYDQRERVAKLKERLDTLELPDARELLDLADYLVRKSVWILGGDGWAYDIGFGGLDHVLCSGANVNILVLDTEVYSNTGGQASKSTPRGAVARFAAAGKRSAKKDLGMHAMQYGNVYVASVAMGANDTQTLRAFLEAESYDGPSLIIAYSHCIAHGIEISDGMQHQKAAVRSGYWPLYRYDPRLREQGKNPLVLDSKDPTIPLEDYVYLEGRYKALTRTDPEAARELVELARQDIRSRLQSYKRLAGIAPEPVSAPASPSS